MVVDDEASLLEGIGKLLSEEGYEVTTCDSSYGALERIKKEFFDLLVIDIRMPEMDGISLLKEVRKIQRGDNRSRVIMITAYASNEAPVKAIRLGADDYIMKPFELEDFLHNVNRNIKLIRLEKERQEYLRRLEDVHDDYKNLILSLTRVIWVKTKDKELEKEIKEVLKKYEKRLRRNNID